MADYQYNYDPGQDPGDGGDWTGWFAIIVSFIFGLWPLTLFLVFRKFMSTPDDRRSQARRERTYRYTYTPRAAAPAPAPAPQKTPAVNPSREALAGTGFIVAGGIVAGLFGFSWLVALFEAIASHSILGSLSGLAALGGFTGAGLVLLYVGFFRRKRSKLFRKYRSLIGARDSVNISTLAKATGRGYKRVCDELQDMLDLGVLPMGYLDLANDRLVLTSQGIADEPAPQSEPQQDEYAILAEIRSVNDAIPDPTMTAKIDRIGQLTGKILDYQRQNPDKAGQLRSFLNYYLPTTLKILRAYAQLDQQGIEGENISAAKDRIEGMMDKVVEGFEKQLDKLFRDEALDIASDVSVLEKMLDKDGLGQGGGLTLGM